MILEDKYLDLLNQTIYDNQLKKTGIISAIEINYYIGGYYIAFQAYLDDFDDKVFLWMDDFRKGRAQFIIITDFILSTEEQVEKIKNIFKEDFSDSMLIYMQEEDRQELLREQKERGIQKLHTDLVNLTDISAETLADDFYSRLLYTRYKEDVINKDELLYGLVNHLAQELKRVKDRNYELSFKYVFPEKMEEFINETEPDS